MRLNNGRFIVDTDDAVMLDSSRVEVLGDGYSHETHRRFYLWQAKKTGKYFITMDYGEFIVGCLPFSGKRASTTGTQLVGVYDKEEIGEKALRFGLLAPPDALEKID